MYSEPYPPSSVQALHEVTIGALRQFNHLSQSWRLLFLSIPLDALTFYFIVNISETFPKAFAESTLTLTLVLIAGISLFVTKLSKQQ